jgi:hypothetical protein
MAGSWKNILPVAVTSIELHKYNLTDESYTTASGAAYEQSNSHVRSSVTL